MKTMQPSALVLFAVAMLGTSSAHAHEIDGNWCSDDGRTLTVHGQVAFIPSGAEVLGEYKDHMFRYVGPANDPEAGHDVRMRIYRSEDLMVERIIEGALQPEERWRRCAPIAGDIRSGFGAS